jgi:hypothetical protein
MIPISRKSWFLAVAALCIIASRHTFAFVVLAPSLHHRLAVAAAAAAAPAVSSVQQLTARDDFEWQELRTLLRSIQNSGVACRDLDPTIRATAVQYARSRSMRMPYHEQQQTGEETKFRQLAQLLPGSTWQLVLTNHAATLGDLPRDATVYLKFVDDQTVDYALEFKKTFGLDSITARSSWTCDAATGLVTFVYQQVTSDAFGLKNIGVGLFGLLKGRANYVETAYFDNQYWIERGKGLSGDEFVNVYVRQEDKTDFW